jgi:hypothetical protein
MSEEHDYAAFTGLLEIQTDIGTGLFFFGDDHAIASRFDNHEVIKAPPLYRIIRTDKPSDNKIDISARGAVAVFVVYDEELDSWIVYQMTEKRYDKFVAAVGRRKDYKERLRQLKLIRPLIPDFHGIESKRKFDSEKR